jgi:histidyl-tRNA synthetase
MDYAGRSVSGQIKYANRVDARYVVIVDGAEATVRERGKQDRNVSLDRLVESLTA